MTEYREVPKDKILKFSATPGFKGWRHFFSKESISHPAKMNLNLLRHILKTYTKMGDIVLDPMAGTGSTVILASSMGRQGIAVEYEAKFCGMIEENIGLLERQSSFIPRGRVVCIQGDARELSKHLIESDVIISSPPYGNRLSDVAIKDGDSARMGYRQTVDVVLTSPPYESTGLDGGDVKKRTERLERAGYNPKDYLGGRARNTILKPYDEIDAIVSSPPYGSDNANLQARKDRSAKSILASTGVRGIELDSENLGNLKYGDIDAVITSPPYESTKPIQDFEIIKLANLNRGRKLSDVESWSIKDEGYGSSPENIGNLKSDNYLEAMLQVYQEAHKVLKSEGTMVLVTKNFIRDKQVVRLDLDTIKLCGSVGFKLIDHLYFKLPTKSFWKHLYHRKYPDVPEVKYEDILVFEKIGVPPKRREK